MKHQNSNQFDRHMIKNRIAIIANFISRYLSITKCWIRKKIFRKSTNFNPEHHLGLLPIRVLQYNIIYWIETVSPDFYKTLVKEVQLNGLQKTIIYNYDKQRIIHAARIDAASINSNRQISIYEPFNAYLWCICHSLLVAFNEIVQIPHLKGKYTGVVDLTNKQIKAALSIFNYGMSLRNGYFDWDISLPNPESFNCIHSYYIGKTNSLFVSAMFFILCHEIGHNFYNHVTYRPIIAQQSQQEELDADNFAIEQVMSCKRKRIIPSLKHGAIAGMCALLFLSPKLYKDGFYPDADNRIRNVIEKLKLNDLDLEWGMASLAFKLWGDCYNINFTLPKTMDNYSQMFYEILQQTNNIKKS
jgi:predicted metallopeptidase